MDKRVFIPCNDWFSFLNQEFPKITAPALLVYYVENLSALAAWRPTQDIIRFDPDLYLSLIRTRLTGNLPSEILQRLPAWAIYIEAPGVEIADKTYSGFFAYLDSCNEPGLVLLDLLFVDEELRIKHITLPLGDWDLPKAVEMTNEDFKRGAAMLNRPVAESSLIRLDSGLAEALNLLIYVCSYGLAEGGKWETSSGRGAYAPKKVKGIWRFFPPDKPNIRLLGSDFGDQLRKYAKTASANANSHHARPRPHVRRAHWHGYWHGPMKKDAEKPRVFNVRWLPPIPVGWLEEEESFAPQIRQNLEMETA